jgi:ABC-type multidrug transport system ATPase subunit
MGRGDGPRELLRCIVGERRPDEGEVTVGGWPARRARRKLGRGLVALDEGDEAPERITFDLAVAANPSSDVAARLAAQPGTLVVATMDPGIARAVGGRVGILRGGRLLVEGDVEDMARRFRRIRYVNRLTEDRTAFGTELDEFEAVRVRVRGWGIEAVVADFRADAFERLRGLDGVDDAAEEPVTFEEIVEAVAGS